MLLDLGGNYLGGAASLRSIALQAGARHSQPPTPTGKAEPVMALGCAGGPPDASPIDATQVTNGVLTCPLMGTSPHDRADYLISGQQEAATGVRGNGDGSSLQYSVPDKDGIDGPPHRLREC
jgi:hypothetical protein